MTSLTDLRNSPKMTQVGKGGHDRNILRFTTGDVGVTLSAIFGVLLAIFRGGVLSPAAVLLLILKLLLSTVVSILSIRKLRYDNSGSLAAYAVTMTLKREKHVAR